MVAYRYFFDDSMGARFFGNSGRLQRMALSEMLILSKGFDIRTARFGMEKAG